MSMGSTTDSGSSHNDGPTRMHENDNASFDRTLVGESTSFKYDDAAGFITEGKVISTDMDDVPENSLMLSSIHPLSEPQHTIKKILERPVKIATITFNNTFGIGSDMGTFDIMPVFRAYNGFRLAREKLSSFYGVNWRAHLKVTLNAQPFESGLFQIYFLPFENSLTYPYLPTNTPDANTLPFTTGCPNVLCNLALQSEVELSVPYTGPIPFINLTNDIMDFGKFHIQCISPITDSTNAPSCELSVYLFFSQVELFGTTPNSKIQTATPQSLNSLQSKEASSKQRSGTSSKPRGPISTIGNTIVDILDMFGLSAPTANLNPERRHIDPYASPATADTVKTPLKLSYLSTQGVEISQLGVDKVDECDINHIIQKPTYLTQFPWTVNQDAGAQLATFKVEPNITELFAVNGSNYVSPTRLRYMANLFRFWRGSIKFTFHVVCNKFHSGRLRFVYTLGGPPPTDMDVFELYPRSFTQVIDIRDATCFEIECEYFASTAWRLVPQQIDVNNFTYRTTTGGFLDDLTPMLTIYAENELRAATTTSNTIQIVCSVSAGKDFEFSVPIATTSYPINVYPPAPTEARLVVTSDEGIESGDWIEVADPQNESVIIAQPQSLSYPTVSMIGDSDDEPTKAPEPMTTGERIQNVRTLIRRYHQIGSAEVDLSAGNVNILLTPYYVRSPSQAQDISYELFPYFSMLFAFYRGGLRYMINSSSNKVFYLLKYNASLPVNYYANEGYFGTRVGAGTTTLTGTAFDTVPFTASVPFQSNLQGGLEIEVPYYSRFHKCLSRRMVSTSLAGTIADEFLGYVPAGSILFQMSTFDKVAENTSFKVYRTVADDFNFGYLLGAPIVNPTITPV